MKINKINMDSVMNEKKDRIEELEERKIKLIKNPRNLQLPKKSVELLKKKNFKKIAASGLIGTFALSAILILSNDKEEKKEENIEKEETIQVEKETKTEKIVEVKQPLKSALVAQAVLPIPEAKVEVKEDKILLKEAQGKLVHAPINGEIKKIEEDAVSIEIESGEVVEISNVQVEKVNVGEKLLQGEAIGKAKEEVEVRVSEKGVYFTEVEKLVDEEKTKNLDVEKFEDWHKGGTSVDSFDTHEERVHFVGKLFQRENLKQAPDEMIYPSIPTTQMLVETGDMTSELANEALNFGGLKADEHWDGPVYNKKTKEQYPDGTEYEIYADFRKFNTIEEYVENYFDRLVQSDWMKERYEGYRVANAETHEAAIKHLSERFATDTKYKEKITKMLESKDLKELDAHVFELAKGVKTVEEVEKEIVQEFEEKQKQTEVTEEVKKTEKKAKEVELDIVAEPFNSDVTNEVTFKGVETPLNEVNFAEMNEEEAKEIVEEMVDLNIYLETKNEFLEKLLKKANITGINEELNGEYSGKYLDFLMEASYRAIDEGQLTEEDKKKIQQRKAGKVEVEVEGEVYVVENKEAVASYNEDLTEKFKREYSRITYGMKKLSLKGMKITLDSGHAMKKGKAHGADPGATSVAANGRSEAQINYEYTIQFKEFLESLGAEVTLLNPNGEHDLRANGRGLAANKTGNDVLFSIHFNSTGDRTVNGTEVAIGTSYDEIDVNFANIIQKHQATAMHTNDDRGLANTRVVGMLGAAKSPKGDIIVEGSFISNIYGMMQAESDVVKLSLMNSWVAGLAEINGTLGEEVPVEAIKWQEQKMLELADKVGKKVEEILASDENILFKEKEDTTEVKIEKNDSTEIEVEKENFEKTEEENTEEKDSKEEKTEEDSKKEKESKENVDSVEEKDSKENGEENVVSMLGLNVQNLSADILDILF